MNVHDLLRHHNSHPTTPSNRKSLIEWSQAHLGDVLRRVRREVTLVDGESYAAVSVLKDGQGLGPKAPFVGGISKYRTLNQIESGDVVLRTITAFESPAAVAGPEHEGAHVSGLFFTYAHTDRVEPGYLRAFFQSPAFWQQMEAKATGSVLRRKTISSDSFLEIRLLLPPLDEQRRIVDLIGALDANITALDSEVASLGAVVASVRKQMLREVEGADVELGSVASFASGYAFSPDSQGGTDGEYPFLKVSDMNLPGNETRMVDANNWVDEETLLGLKARAWPAGTVIFPKVGAALLTEKRRILVRNSAFDNNVMGLVPGPKITSDFLLAVMREVRLSDFAQNGAVPSINQGHVRSIRVKLPTLANQLLVTEVLSAGSSHLAAGALEAETLRGARAALLSALLSGEVEIPESYDELAGVA
jgi:type I restriction enzyme S subunit